jgi:hypothetical protein
MRRVVSIAMMLVVPAVLLAGCGGTDGSAVDPGGTDEATDPGAGTDEPDPGGDDSTEQAPGTEEDAVTDEGTDPTDGDAAGGDGAAGSELAHGLGPRVEEAIALLVDDGVDPDTIEVVLAEPVVWSDGSIGCPEPGMMYTQALVDGYRIVLDVDGDEVAFHGQSAQPPFRCDGPVEPLQGGAPSS